MQPPVVQESHDRVQCVLVMPAYNEEGCIQKVVTNWQKHLQGVFGREALCLVVNDGSRDNTGRLLDDLAAHDARLRVKHQANAGHGAALLRGYREALALNPEYVFHVDSDDQFDPADFDGLWARRAESTCILGYRIARDDAFHRLVITRILRALLSWMFGLRARDANIPFRLMRADFLKEALARMPDAVFAPNIFITIIAAHQGADLLNIPVRHIERKTGSVSIVRWKLVKVCWRCLRELLEFRKCLAALAA